MPFLTSSSTQSNLEYCSSSFSRRNGTGYSRIHDPSSRIPAVQTVSPCLRDKVGYVFTVIRILSRAMIRGFTGA